MFRLLQATKTTRWIRQVAYPIGNPGIINELSRLFEQLPRHDKCCLYILAHLLNAFNGRL